MRFDDVDVDDAVRSIHALLTAGFAKDINMVEQLVAGMSDNDAKVVLYGITKTVTDMLSGMGVTPQHHQAAVALWEASRA